MARNLNIDPNITNRTGEIKYGLVFDYYKYFYEEVHNSKVYLTSTIKTAFDGILRMSNIDKQYMKYIDDEVEVIYNNDLIQIFLMKYRVNYITIERLNNGYTILHINQYLLNKMRDDLSNLLKIEEKNFNAMQVDLNRNRNIIEESLKESDKCLQDLRREKNFLIKFFYNFYLKKKSEKLNHEIKNYQEMQENKRVALREKDIRIRSLYTLGKLLEILGNERSINEFTKSIKDFLKDRESDYRLVYVTTNDETHDKLFRKPNDYYNEFHYI